MSAARIITAAVFFTLALVAGVAGRVCAQSLPDFPTGGTVANPINDPDRPQQPVSGSESSLSRFASQLRSGALVYRWFAPAIRRPELSLRKVKLGPHRLAR